MRTITHHIRHHGNATEGLRRPVELISGAPVRGRRDWSDEEKLSIVAESFATTTSVSAVARRYGLNRNQLFAWRRLFREGDLGGADEVGAFAPVMVEPADGVSSSPPSGLLASDEAAQPAVPIDIEVGGMTVRVPPSADSATLRQILLVIGSLR